MLATDRSEGIRVSRLASIIFLAFFGLLGLAGDAAAGRAERKVFETYFTFPSSLPAGYEARLAAYNTGADTARVRIEPAQPAPGELYEAMLPQGGTKVLRFSWIRPGRLIKLISTTLQVDVYVEFRDGNGALIEQFPIDLEAATRHDFVLPVADSNSACPAAEPGNVAANTTLQLTSLDLLSPADYQVKAYSASGALLDTETVPAGLLGAAVGVALSNVFDSGTLDDTRTVRVYSEDQFTGYGYATVAPEDVVGILPMVASTYWEIQDADGQDPKLQNTDLIFYNPGATGAPVKVDELEFTVAAGEVVTIPWPGEEADIDADLPVALFVAHAEIGGCGVTARIACPNNRPWSVPDLSGWEDVLVSESTETW